MLADNQRIWGFETNYGGLAYCCCRKANELMPKAAHLTWEESGDVANHEPPTSVSDNAVSMTQGDVR